ncbi:hypothetical protein QBC35DRAFT_509150 [Podospora australis]|uniref:Uncharacterized protein n=1 Tax=Podospora australis TaxID=1536484 RepID=A0AAN6WKD4_9PEZI|nr:hypothetical protein QBC35DRAFT_509150 [Podospora australis]
MRMRGSKRRWSLACRLGYRVPPKAHFLLRLSQCTVHRRPRQPDSETGTTKYLNQNVPNHHQRQPLSNFVASRHPAPHCSRSQAIAELRLHSPADSRFSAAPYDKLPGDVLVPRWRQGNRDAQRFVPQLTCAEPIFWTTCRDFVDVEGILKAVWKNSAKKGLAVSCIGNKLLWALGQWPPLPSIPPRERLHSQQHKETCWRMEDRRQFGRVKRSFFADDSNGGWHF